MENDDVFSPILGRRQILRGAGAFGLLGLARFALPGAVPNPLLEESALSPDLDVSDLVDEAALDGMCVLSPSLTAGPYYQNLNLVRQNITEGQWGLTTRMFLTVVRASDCTPIPNAAVDLWHNNAPGVYSGYANQGTQGQTWLRGVQFTDVNGLAWFDTIYPGWYPGRTTHMHLKVRPTGSSELTTQLYFPQALSNRIYGRTPYASHGQNPTTNASDPLYRAETVVNVLGIVQGVGLELELTIGVA